MKQLGTIICSICFVIAGALVIGMKPGASTIALPGAMTTYAKPQPFSINELDLPLDIQLDLDKRTKHDTVYIDNSRVDTVYRYKTKIQKVAVPEVVEVHDTLSVPVFYLATPLEFEAGSTEIIIYDNAQIVDSTEINHAGSTEGEQ